MWRAIFLFLVLAMVPAIVVAQTDGGRVADTSADPSRRQTPMVEEALPPQALEGPIDPDTYTLGPSDELLLVIGGPQTKLNYLMVLPEGNVILPNHGSLQAAGLTLTEFRAAVRKALARFYRNVDIDCQLSRARSFVVFVVGEVAKPKPVELTAPFRVSYAVTAAGGVKETGSMREIEIREDGKVLHKVDLFRFFKRGDFEHNPALKEGQSVYVPPKRNQVFVVGEVRLPGDYELVEGETAADVIEFCGGLSSQGNPENLLVERTVDGEVKSPIVFGLDEAASIEMHDMDRLIVRDLLSYRGIEPVRVVGGGGRTGNITIDQPEALRDFLGRLWRFNPVGYNIKTAVLERNNSDGDSLYFVFDVSEALQNGPVGDTPVRPGDILSFPPTEDEIFVTGEVSAPGPIPFLPGFTAEHYISRAGGPASGGTFNRLTIIGADGSTRGGDRNALIYRGDTIIVNRSKSRIFGSVFAGALSLTAVVLSIIAISSN